LFLYSQKVWCVPEKLFNLLPVKYNVYSKPSQGLIFSLYG